MKPVASFLRDVTPPLVWRWGQRARGRLQVANYQGVTTPFNMAALHRGAFADTYDAAYPNDPAFRREPHIRRLRAYFAWMFAELASQVPGDYLAAGVSYGVMPKVISELTLKKTTKTFHLIDALRDDEDCGYCNEPASIAALFAGDPWVRLHVNVIPDVFPIALPDGLAFVQLDTSDEDAELASLPYLIEQLNPGGLLIADAYAWQNFAPRYDEIAARYGAVFFTLPSGQGVLHKR
jgi:hypothetical protein